MLKKTKELNDLLNEKANLMEEQDIEKEVQEAEDKHNMAIARKQFVRMQLEGEKPIRFFYKMNKKRLAKAKFEELHVVEKDKDEKESVEMITKQKSIEWEV